MILYYANARSAFLMDAWLWWVVPPGVCIALAVLGFALIGYALEEQVRPRLRTLRVAPSPRPLPQREREPSLPPC